MMIPGIMAQRRHGGGPALGTTNIMRDGSYLSHTYGSPFESYTGSPPRINNGQYLLSSSIVNTGYGRTTFGGPNGVNGGACEVTFNAPVALGRFGISAYPDACNYVFEARVGGIWITVSTQANKSAMDAISYYDFNNDASVVSDRWRWRIASWVSTGNFYAGELEAYKFDA